MHWVSKVVKATVGPRRGKQAFNMSGTSHEKMDYIYDVTFFGRFCEDFTKMLWS